jgi:hypothetical protein
MLNILYNTTHWGNSFTSSFDLPGSLFTSRAFIPLCGLKQNKRRPMLGIAHLFHKEVVKVLHARLIRGALFVLAFLLPFSTLTPAKTSDVMASVGTVKSHQKISDTEGNFTGILDDGDYFGMGATGLGDLDGDGIPDMAVGAYGDDDGGDFRGAVWILFLNADGTVKSHQKISDTEGGFTGALHDRNAFGWSLTSLGDFDGDGVIDLAVGAREDDDGGNARGAVFILLLNSNGTVKSQQKISDTQGGFTGALDNLDRFGYSISALGDLDGDGVCDLAVGAAHDDDGGYDIGAVWVLFLNSDGTVKSHQKIGSMQGGFTGELDSGDNFGVATVNIGDLDNDGVVDIGVCAIWDDDGGYGVGAVWVLFLNSDGTVKSHQKISATEGGFTGSLDSNDRFGWALSSLGDLDCDGVYDLAATAFRDDDGGSEVGATWLLFLNSNGTVKSHQKISATEGDFTGPLENDDYFGISVALIGDLDCDGVNDLAVGADGDDDGGTRRGAVWMLFLNGETCPGIAFDISPRSCPNPFNIQWLENIDKGKGSENSKMNKGGVMPAAIVGNESFDVAEVDVSTLLLEGVAPLRSNYEDVTRPVGSSEACACTTGGPDGFMDLTLKFSRQEVAAAIGSVEVQDVVELTLTGEMLDGTPFEASDCVTIVGNRNDLPSLDSSDEVVLKPAIPNPFNPVTRIGYYLPREDFVKLSIYDVTGRRIDDLVKHVQSAGDHVIEWNASHHVSGIYFYRIEVGEFTDTQKLILLK